MWTNNVHVGVGYWYLVGPVMGFSVEGQGDRTYNLRLHAPASLTVPLITVVGSLLTIYAISPTLQVLVVPEK